MKAKIFAGVFSVVMCASASFAGAQTSPVVSEPDTLQSWIESELLGDPQLLEDIMNLEFQEGMFVPTEDLTEVVPENIGGGVDNVKFLKSDSYVFYAPTWDIGSSGEIMKTYYYRLEGAEPNSFRALNLTFSKDANQVYYKQNTITGADPATFELLSDRYARDYSSVYVMDKRLVGADAESFEVLGRNTPSEVGVDRTHLYFEGLRTRIDRKSFALAGEGVYRDKNYVYLLHEGGKPLQKIPAKKYDKELKKAR